MVNFRRIRDDFFALALFAGAVFVGLCLVSYDAADPPSDRVWPPATSVANFGGEPGARVAFELVRYTGAGCWFVLLCMLTSDARLFSREGLSRWVSRLLGMALSLTAVCVTLQMLLPDWSGGPLVGGGGYIGAWGLIVLEREFSPAGVYIVIGTLLTSGLLLSGDLSAFGNVLHAVTAPLRLLRYLLINPFRRSAPVEPDNGPSGWDADAIPLDTEPTAEPAMQSGPAEAYARTECPADAHREPKDLPINGPPNTAVDLHPDDEPEPLPVDADLFAASSSIVVRSDAEPAPVPVPKSLPAMARKPLKVNPPVGAGSVPAATVSRSGPAFELPSPALLETPEAFPYELLAAKARAAAQTLERTFQEFGLNIQVVEVDTGPVITQFELSLEAGLRLSKVSALADDLAIALRVPSVRVVAPIPGKNTVGVEVPNDKQVMVRLRELLESCPQDRGEKRIPLYVGKDVSGRPLVVDMTKMPHLLIAGRTGTGKSVCLNALILSILMTRTPDEVKMLMIDPKMVELSPYRRVPHLMHPVITDMKKAEAVLAWAVDKMEERYDLLARAGVRHLDGYNKLGRDEILNRLGLDPDDPEDMLEAEAVPEKMPYIVIVADEMADMMMTSGKDVESHIIRLAQKSRAVGIHLVLATQKPTVDVITGLIKSNLPARISFQVASRTDSRVVLDEMGAERLLGNGDMLFLTPGTSNVIRAQGAYVSDEEVGTIVDFYSAYEPQYSQELARLKVAPAGGGKGGEDLGGSDHRDELYEQAVEVVLREQMGSVSRLQRFLGIGYGRAARLIDYMAEDGLVGDYNGSKAREVLYTLEEWESLKGRRETAEVA
jgi:S-DNA-T family DNA segregation ATPase FtsK/SpoIIIE